MSKMNSDASLLFFCLILFGLIVGIPVIDHHVRQIPNEKHIDIIEIQPDLPLVSIEIILPNPVFLPQTQSKTSL